MRFAFTALSRQATSLALLAFVALAAPAPATATAPTPTPSTAAIPGMTRVPDPRGNIAPSPEYRMACWANGNPAGQQSTACRTQVLAAINHAHAVEHIRAITLPANYWSLPAAQQVFVIDNLERVSRGLHPVQGLVSQLSTAAQYGAAHNVDPRVPSWHLTNGAAVTHGGAIWAGDYNTLDADYSWMYMDGWGGSRAATSNLDCTYAAARGCWGHREVMLGYWGGTAYVVAGAGSVAHGAGGYFNSVTELFESYSGRVPAFTYTWAQAVRAGAR
ncbi:MAG TPA: hypothetical protein VGN48_17750 [Pedococcus sp.]|jgi:hypothetical protein|nr:hypothetical protein [Pedococcus sp.]